MNKIDIIITIVTVVYSLFLGLFLYQVNYTKGETRKSFVVFVSGYHGLVFVLYLFILKLMVGFSYNPKPPTTDISGLKVQINTVLHDLPKNNIQVTSNDLRLLMLNIASAIEVQEQRISTLEKK